MYIMHIWIQTQVPPGLSTYEVHCVSAVSKHKANIAVLEHTCAQNMYILINQRFSTSGILQKLS